MYMELGELYVEKTGRGYAGPDIKTDSSVRSKAAGDDANAQVPIIACLEEIAFHQGFIN
jgi:hypothetical protein